MVRIFAPNQEHNGFTAGVQFKNGVGETDDPKALRYFERAGYAIGEPPVVEPEVEPEPEAPADPDEPVTEDSTSEPEAPAEPEVEPEPEAPADPDPFAPGPAGEPVPPPVKGRGRGK